MRFTISSIEMTNYRQYQGNQTLDFSFDKNKNVSIILGQNGAGKSNLLNALTWCFYGKEIHTDQQAKETDGMPIINVAELDALEPGRKTFAEVVVSIYTNAGQWRIKRHIDVLKDNLGKLHFDQPQLIVTYPFGGQDKIVEGDETQRLINNLLPEALRQFFFIDGEQLREFFRISNPTEIAKAIENVSQLELMYKAAENLETYENQLRKNVKATTPQFKKVQQKIQILKGKNEKAKESLQKNKEELEKDISELAQVEDYLRKHNDAVVSKLQEERELLEKDITSLNRHLKDAELERNGYLVDTAPYILLKDEIESAYSLIQQKVEKGDLPPRIRETFVRELIDSGRCICGNEIKENEKHKLESYSRKLELSELSEVCIVGKTTLDEILLDIEEFPSKIDQLNKKIEEFKDEYDEKKRRLDYISETLKKHNIEEIRAYEERRKKLTNGINKNENLIKMLEAEITTINKDLDEALSEERKELSKDKKNAQLRAKLQLVQEALKTLAETEYIIKSKIRKQVERTTKENFLKLLRKKAAFKDIVIEDTFDVKVIHSQGYNAINYLSAGEYMILGLSFMSALMTISGFHAPVIIDTPLGKIDDEHREYITTELPKFLQGTQLILLVTPTEYDDTVRKNLQEYLLEENFFKIVENESKTISKVISHGH